MLKITLPYDPPNWNEYINMERKNFYMANNLKQKEKQIVKLATIGVKWDEGYPISITFYPHFDNLRRDLDNTRCKGCLDGLVSAGVIENDNLRCIQEIHIIPVFDKEEKIEIEIKKIDQ